MLIETHVEASQYSLYNNLFEGYEIRWLPAKRVSQRGRACGGIVCGVKLNSPMAKYIKFETHQEFIVIHYDYKYKGTIQSISFVPVYLNRKNWDKDFTALLNFVEEKSFSNLVIMGDCNVRIGTLQVLPEETTIDAITVSAKRNSRDLLSDSQGRRLVQFCDDNGLVILNGRTNGDRRGDFTFIGSSGSSVNDLCCFPLNLIDLIKSMEVDTQIFSDHLPLILKLETEETINPHKLSLIPKLKWSNADDQNFSKKCESLISTVEDWPTDVEYMQSRLLECIRACSSAGKNSTLKDRFKNDWFDYECFRERSTTFKLLRMHKKIDSVFVREQYVQARNKLKILFRQKEKSFYRNIERKLSEVRNSKDFWTLVRLLKGKVFSASRDILPVVWVNHFRDLLNPCLPRSTIMFAEPLNRDDLLDSVFTLEDLNLVLSKVKNNKAPGTDGIPFEFFKRLPQNALLTLLNLFNNIFCNHDIPSSFKKAIIFPLHKKGAIEDVQNYRGISFLNSISKLFSGLLLNRISNWVEAHNILSESQAGFRKGYSTADNIFSLVSLIKNKLSYKRKKVYAFFIDFSSAFDTVDLRSLWYKLYIMGLSSKVVKVLQAMYTDTMSAVWTREGITDFFNTEVGLRQGCILSPILFSLFINDLPESLGEDLGAGVWIRKVCVRLLMYADDIVMLSSDPKSLQKMIDRLALYCDKWNLVLNLNKSKVMVFRNGGRYARAERWWYKGRPVEVVNSYKYLGISLTPSLSLDMHFTSKVSDAKFAINSVWREFIGRQQVPYDAKLKVFHSVSKAVVCYGAQVWGFSAYERLEGLMKYFIKKLFSLPSYTPAFILYLELRLDPIFIHTLSLHLKYMSRLNNLPPNRLPALMARETLSRETFWVNGWRKLEAEYEVSFQIQHFMSDRWDINPKDILNKVRVAFRVKMEEATRSSVSHSLYRNLSQLEDKQSYISLVQNFSHCKWIFKLRGELINLNFKPWKGREETKCTLCSCGVAEDTFHFFSVCPALSELRQLHLGRAYLTPEEALDWANGRNWARLASYCEDAYKKRGSLM
jgi:hypothetical protein